MKTQEWHGLVMRTVFDYKILSKANYSLPMVHQPIANGETSRLYATSTHLHTNGNNYCRLSYMRFVTRLLPYPYNTRCQQFDNSTMSKLFRERCHKKCMVDSIAQRFQLVPFTEIYQTADLNSSWADLKLLSQRRDTPTMSKLLNSIGINCSQQCPQVCYTDIYVTKVQYSARFTEIDGMTFRLDLPYWPKINIEFKPRQKLYEYIIYVMSCVGTWLNISIIQLNPFQKSPTVKRLLVQSGFREFDSAADLKRREYNRYRQRILTKFRSHLYPQNCYVY